MTQPQKFQEIAENLSFLDDWEDQFEYIIELGKALPKLSDAERVPENKVSGCVAQVWLAVEQVPSDAGSMFHIKGESDAMIVQGLVAVLLALYSDRPASEIAATDAMAIFDEMGLRAHLTTQRSNGLNSMVNRIRAQAQAASA